MPRRRERPARLWKVQSVSVNARDGAERLTLVYRRLLSERSRPGPSLGVVVQPARKQEGAR